MNRKPYCTATLALVLMMGCAEGNSPSTRSLLR